MVSALSLPSKMHMMMLFKHKIIPRCCYFFVSYQCQVEEAGFCASDNRDAIFDCGILCCGNNIAMDVAQNKLEINHECTQVLMD